MAKELDYDRFIDSFTNRHSIDLHDRQIACLEKIVKYRRDGLFYDELSATGQLLRFAFEKVESGVLGFVPAVSEIIRTFGLCPLLKKKGGDSIRSAAHEEEFVAIIADFLVSTSTELRSAAADSLSEYLEALSDEPNAVVKTSSRLAAVRKCKAVENLCTALADEAEKIHSLVVQSRAQTPNSERPGSAASRPRSASGPRASATSISLLHFAASIAGDDVLAANAIEHHLIEGGVVPFFAFPFGDPAVSVSVDILWNCVSNKSTAEAAKTSLANVGPLESLRSLLLRLLREGHRIRDKEIRNEVLVLTLLVVTDSTERVDTMVDCGLVDLFLTFATYTEKKQVISFMNDKGLFEKVASLQAWGDEWKWSTIVKPFAITSTAEDFEMKKLMLSLSSKCYALSEKARARGDASLFVESLLLFIDMDFVLSHLHNAAVTPRPSMLSTVQSTVDDGLGSGGNGKWNDRQLEELQEAAFRILRAVVRADPRPFLEADGAALLLRSIVHTEELLDDEELGDNRKQEATFDLSSSLAEGYRSDTKRERHPLSVNKASKLDHLRQVMKNGMELLTIACRLRGVTPEEKETVRTHIGEKLNGIQILLRLFHQAGLRVRELSNRKMETIVAAGNGVSSSYSGVLSYGREEDLSSMNAAERQRQEATISAANAEANSDGKATALAETSARLTRKQSVTALAFLCEENEENKACFGEEGGVEILASELIYDEDDAPEEEPLVLSIVDCLWNAVPALPLSEDKFLNIDGVNLLLSLLEVCKSSMHGQILGFLTDLLKNPRTSPFVRQWQSPISQRSSIQLFLALWDSGLDESLAETMPSLEEKESISNALKSDEFLAKVTDGGNINTKIFSLLSKIGFDKARIVSFGNKPGHGVLTADEKKLLVRIESYLSLRLGDLMKKIVTELEEEGIRPVSRDGDYVREKLTRRKVEEEKVSSAVGQIHADLENSHQEDEERFFESIREVAAMEIQTGKNEKGNRRALLLTQQSDARTKRTKTIKKNTDLPPRPPTGESVSGSESGAVIAHGRRAGQASPRVQSPKLDESTSRTRGPL
uniref:Cilia- and flagella-associated protein 69 ARM repeats domain-containing protein n=1 Tax=Palpitomonas bilix TaxID=652834 RepID=A0A7S3GF56_9EUKA|mmetsp:Transcript_46863/g.120744  ORF Transcript_46863/g.120744 Transcript_46863/m.120744 type:complete len:1058 (+) Transcript_46863:141-3314(+)